MISGIKNIFLNYTQYTVYSLQIQKIYSVLKPKYFLVNSIFIAITSLDTLQILFFRLQIRKMFKLLNFNSKIDCEHELCEASSSKNKTVKIRIFSILKVFSVVYSIVSICILKFSRIIDLFYCILYINLNYLFSLTIIQTNISFEYSRNRKRLELDKSS